VSTAVPEYVVALLRESLPAWGLAGVVCRSADGGLEVRAATVHLRIGGRERAVSGVPGLLRTVRASIDPSYRPIAVRIAALPLAP
jgi:hypothetical protein